jgi:hypothetical protein
MLELESEDTTPFPHKEITEAIIGSAFEVYNHLGYGFLNRVYQRSLQVELMRRGFSGYLERRTTVRYKEVIVGARRSSAVECAKSDRPEDWHSPEFRPVQGRIQTTHLLNLCLICVHPWPEEAEMISSG